MRIVSVDRKYDIPYKIAVVYVEHNETERRETWEVKAEIDNRVVTMGKYKEKENCKQALLDMQEAFETTNELYYYFPSEETAEYRRSRR